MRFDQAGDERKNPARRPGFHRQTAASVRATAYPAGCRMSGRRARDVIPAAARALVRTVGDGSWRWDMNVPKQ
jgi:hypothetical protein